MASEFELSDYSTIQEHKATETNRVETGMSGRRLLRIGIVTLGVLCILQAALNVSLRLAFYSKEDTDQFPFNISAIAELYTIDQSQQNATQLCVYCNNLLRRLLREYKRLETERDFLHNKVIQLTRDQTIDDEDFQGSGSGY